MNKYLQKYLEKNYNKLLDFSNFLCSNGSDLLNDLIIYFYDKYDFCDDDNIENLFYVSLQRQVNSQTSPYYKKYIGQTKSSYKKDENVVYNHQGKDVDNKELIKYNEPVYINNTDFENMEENTYTPLSDDYDYISDKVIFEDKINIIENILIDRSLITFGDMVLFNMYFYDNLTYRHIEDLTGIKYSAIHKIVKKTKDIIKNNI